VVPVPNFESYRGDHSLKKFLSNPLRYMQFPEITPLRTLLEFYLWCYEGVYIQK
jgi:hypothetical protein